MQGPLLPATPPTHPGQHAKGQCLNHCHTCMGLATMAACLRSETGTVLFLQFLWDRDALWDGASHRPLLPDFPLQCRVCCVAADGTDGANPHSKCPLKNRGAGVVCGPVNTGTHQGRGYLLNTPWLSVSKLGILWGRYVTASLLERV